jgi:hypothetical protein
MHALDEIQDPINPRLQSDLGLKRLLKRNLVGESCVSDFG